MKKSLIIASLLFTAVIATNCAKTGDPSAEASSSASLTPACTPTTTLTGTQTANVSIPANACYAISGIVKFQAGTTLTIGQGAKILADTASASTTVLIIAPGATINATGTAGSPIVFTSAKNVGSRAPGDWGGIIIRGNAPVHTGTYTSEADDSGTSGGATSADNSGTMQYVRIEFGGKQMSSTKEYNGLTLEAVGSGTTLDYIHAHRIADDGFEFFGGTVNIKHFISTSNGDDMLDWTYGWVGKAQFGILALNNGDSGADSNGIEADNSEIDNTRTPFSNPTIYNVTMVSSGGEWRNIMLLRRGTKGMFYNFYIGNWCDVITISDAQTTTNVTNNELKLQNALFEGIKRDATNGTGGTCDGTATTDKTSAGILAATGYDGFLSAATVTASAAVANGFNTANWTATAQTAAAFQPTTTIATNAATPPNDGFFDNTASFIGAMNQTTNWASWTAFPNN